MYTVIVTAYHSSISCCNVKIVLLALTDEKSRGYAAGTVADRRIARRVRMAPLKIEEEVTNAVDVPILWTVSPSGTRGLASRSSTLPPPCAEGQAFCRGPSLLPGPTLALVDGAYELRSKPCPKDFNASPQTLVRISNASKAWSPTRKSVQAIPSFPPPADPTA